MGDRVAVEEEAAEEVVEEEEEMGDGVIGLFESETARFLPVGETGGKSSISFTFEFEEVVVIVERGGGESIRISMESEIRVDWVYFLFFFIIKRAKVSILLLNFFFDYCLYFHLKCPNHTVRADPQGSPPATSDWTVEEE